MLKLPLLPKSSAGCSACSLALPGAEHGLAVAGVVAIQVLVILRQAGRGEASAGVGGLTVPLVEAEPVVLAGHGVAVVGNLLASEVGRRAKDPQVHHDLGRLVRDRRVPTVVAPDRRAIHIPGDAIRQPLKAIGVEFSSCVALEIALLGRCNSWSPPFRVVSTENIGGHRAGGVACDLNVNLPPVMELGIAENEHGGNEIPIHIWISGLHVRSLHAHLIAPIAEDVPARAELAADQWLVLHSPHLRVGAGLCRNARVAVGSDLHLAVLKSDLLFHEAHVALVKATIRPGPDWIAV